MKKSFLPFFLFTFSLLPLLAQGSWHPELDHWPRTVLEAGQIPLVQSRVLTAPYNDAYANVLSESEIEYSSCELERDKAEVCRNAAFRFLIEADSLSGDKAQEYLLIAQRETSDGYQETYNNIIWDAENLSALCTAYDFLKGSGYQFETESVIRSNIKSIAAGLYYDIMENYLIHIGWEATGKKNNFGVKLASALGLAAIVLNTETSDLVEEQPQTWINYSMELLNGIFTQYQVDESGGWAEGPHYQSFVAYNLIPFLFAHNNFLDGASEDYAGLELPPWLANELFQNTIDWSIKIRTPLGYRPNFDDSFNQPCYYNGFFAQYYENDTYAWDQINSSSPYYTNTNPGDLSIELICQLDDSYPGSTEPDFLSCFLPASGQAVFRSSWYEDAVYMCLLGENGIARTGGIAHEHPDNMSFIIYAGGELLAMDCGYISYDQHDLVRYPEDHSLILVDGAGPSVSNSAASGGTDAFIQDYFHLPGLDFAKVVTNYQNTDFIRNVSFIGEDFFLINDIVSGSEEHNYEWLLHGNGGGDTGNDFQLTQDGALYTVNGVDLNLFITSDSDLELSSYDDYHEQAYDVAGQHTVTKAAVLADNTVFSAFLFPTDDPLPINYSTQELPAAAVSQIEWDGASTISFTKHNNETLESEFTGISLSTNAYVTIISEGSQDIPSLLQILEGNSFIYSGVELISSSVMNDISLEIDDGTASGFVRSACELSLFTGNMPETVDGAVSWSYDSGLLNLTMEADSYFNLVVDWALENNSSEEVEIPSAITDLRNFPNPFNPSTTISFNLTAAPTEDTQLCIYNIEGQKIKEYSIFNIHSSIFWNGTDQNNQPVPSGIYLYKLTYGDQSLTRKMLLLK